MSSKSRIEWTEQTWNPVVGCTKVSPGCKHCYAEAMAERLCAMGVHGYENGFAVTEMPHRLDEPLKRKKRTVYFVNSMSDVFHEAVSFSYIDRIFDVIEATPQHTYQILTKRAERMASYFSSRTPPPNVWMGVSVEDKKFGLARLKFLREVGSNVRFLSIEPLLESLGEFDLTGIHWVIVGGESGPKARPMQKIWVEEIQRQCTAKGVEFFFKQWGGWGEDGKRRAKKKQRQESERADMGSDAIPG